MARGLLIHGIDQVEGVLGEAPLVGCGIDPYGKELAAQISPAGLVQADVAFIVRISRADVEVFVEKTLRGIRVGIDDQSGVVNLVRPGANDSVRPVLGFRGSLSDSE